MRLSRRFGVIPSPAGAAISLEIPRGTTRADVVVEGPDWVVVIEAKVLAGEGERQGERLAEQWPDATHVFLTRRGEEMQTAGTTAVWMPYRWTHMFRLVEVAVADVPEPRDARGRQARAAVVNYLAGTGGLRI